MTRQEELFFDRVALKMLATGQSIEDAARAVCADDVRIFNTYSRLSEAKQSQFKQALITPIYHALLKGGA